MNRLTVLVALALVASSCAAPKAAEPVAPKTLDIQPLPADASAALSVEPKADEPRVAESELATQPEPEPIEKTAPRHRSKLLDGAARPSKLAAGNYACRIGA